MLKGFRDFILRGNVIDLAVAVIIGAGVWQRRNLHRQELNHAHYCLDRRSTRFLTDSLPVDPVGNILNDIITF